MSNFEEFDVEFSPACWSLELLCSAQDGWCAAGHYSKAAILDRYIRQRMAEQKRLEDAVA